MAIALFEQGAFIFCVSCQRRRRCDADEPPPREPRATRGSPVPGKRGNVHDAINRRCAAIGDFSDGNGIALAGGDIQYRFVCAFIGEPDGLVHAEFSWHPGHRPRHGALVAGTGVQAGADGTRGRGRVGRRYGHRPRKDRTPSACCDARGRTAPLALRRMRGRARALHRPGKRPRIGGGRRRSSTNRSTVRTACEAEPGLVETWPALPLSNCRLLNSGERVRRNSVPLQARASVIPIISAASRQTGTPAGGSVSPWLLKPCGRRPRAWPAQR